MVLDFVSLVPAGDDPMASVVISKIAPTTEPQESPMGDISKDDLPDEVVEYIEGLETEVETLTKQAETDAATITARDASLAEKDEQIAKMAPKDDEAAEAISKSALEKMDPGTRSIIEKMQADSKAQAEQIKKAADAEAERVALSKAEAMPMIAEDRSALGGLLRRLSDALTPEDSAEVEKILKSANEQIAQGNLFASLGTGGGEVTMSASVEKAAEAITKADPSLTKEQAIAKAYETNPDLLREAMTNQEG